MKPHPLCNEEALLLLLHGELSLSVRLRLLVHLAGCSHCRTDLRQYAKVSKQLAHGLAQPGQPPRPIPALTLPAPLWVTAGLALLILGSLGALGWQIRKAYAPLPHAAMLDNEECPPPAGTDLSAPKRP